MFIDSHTHLNVEQFEQDQEEVIERARQSGVSAIVNIGFNRETIPTSIELAERYDFIYSTVGWHPNDILDLKEEDYYWIKELAAHEKVVAIGEIGLDYHWNKASKEIQKEAFRRQIRLAKEVGLPVVIHNREAHLDVLTILKEENAAEVGGVMHCFSGSWETAKQCIDMNFYISFAGPITFKNAKQPKEVLAKVPLERLMIETDAPYLTPHPYRGKRNESAYVKFVAEAAAEIKGIPVQQLAEVTAENTRRLFSKM